MEKIKIGKIVNAAGLKGEVKVYNYSAARERYESLACVYTCGGEHKIEKVRYVKGAVILKLSGIDDRDAAEAAKSSDVYISEADLPELSEGEYFIRDLIGLTVIDHERGLVGSLCDVIQNNAQDLYEVEAPDGRKILIPAVEEFITCIDMEKKEMSVRLIDGLI